MSDQVAEMSATYLVEAGQSDVPVGYKQTEVGVIPKGWLVEPLENFTSFISYGFTNPMPTTDNGPYMITARDIANGKIQYKSARNTDINAFNTLLTSKSKPKIDDLLLTKDGTLGRLALVDNELLCINQSVAILRLNQRIAPPFLKLLLESPSYQEKMLEEAGGSTIKHIYITIVNRMLLGVPRALKEQTAIANALSDVDVLISELEKLIAKKQAIKTATMQQLLTGRTRLPQFALREDGTPKGYKQSELGEMPEDWEWLEVGKFAPLQRGFDLPSTIRKDGKYPVVYSNGIANTHHQFQVKGPGVVTGRSGTLGKVHFVDTDYWPHNTSLWVTNFDKADPKFVYFLFTYIGFERFASGSGVPTLNRNDAHSFKTALPPTKFEQTAIATILSEMDEEIQALEQRLGKTRQIKQGMMQELLTGKTRLVAPAA